MTNGDDMYVTIITQRREVYGVILEKISVFYQNSASISVKLIYHVIIATNQDVCCHP